MLKPSHVYQIFFMFLFGTFVAVLFFVDPCIVFLFIVALHFSCFCVTVILSPYDPFKQLVVVGTIVCA